MAISLIGAIGVGVLGRAYTQRNGIVLDDPETIFILLAETLFPALITGFLFAALLAAIMSTVSSQLLVSSSSLAEDVYRLLVNKKASDKAIVTVGRIAVVAVGAVAALIASDPDSKVLGLVANAWAGFGAAFGPLMILSLTWSRMTGTGAVAGLVVGALTVIAWISLGWNASFLGGPGIYEIIPGFLFSMAAIVIVSLATEAKGEFRPLAATDQLQAMTMASKPIPETMFGVVLTGHGGLDKLAWRDDLPVPARGRTRC
jgi:SSS family solute:Na+ symporter